MSYVPGFRNDLFVSYGHLDNQANWVTDFHAELLKRLQELLGTGNIAIWRDATLRGPDNFSEHIHQNVSSSALFISILSPRYVESSTSCREELDYFVNTAGGNNGLRLDMQSRLIRVVKTKLEEGTQPKNFNSTLGYEFYEDDPQRPAIIREYGSRPGMARYEKFVDHVDVLAQEVARMLRRMRQLGPTRETIPRTVFLAQTVSDLEPRRASIWSELTGRGHTVLPAEPLPDTGSEVIAVVEALLAKADISVHLFGRSYGVNPQDETRSYGELLYKLALANQERSGFHQLVWIPGDLQISQERQQVFLKTVRGGIDHSVSGRADLYETSFESFKEGLLDLISRKLEPPPIHTPGKAKAVYLMCDQPDLLQPQLEKIKAYLRGRGHPVDLPPFQGEPEELRQMEEELIDDTDAALIYYGSAKDLWVLRKRKNVLKMLSKKPTGRDYARALYLGMPRDDIKVANYLNDSDHVYDEGRGFKPLLVLGDCGEFQPDKLDAFVKLIEGGN
jgi:hypothetical protein